MYSQIILLLFGLHTISAQLKNIPPPPVIPRLDVASLPNHLQKLLAHVNDLQSNVEGQGPQTISRAHTYGMSLRSGQGEVWNDITGNYTNDIASSEPISPSNSEASGDRNNYHQTTKADEIAAPQTSSGKTGVIENYKDNSNDDQRLPSITPPQTLSLEKLENEDQRGNSNPDKTFPYDIVQSQMIPVPTKLEDQKFKKTPSPKTYGMNLASGHGHIWNNIGGSHLDVNDATPSKSVYSESKDKYYPTVATNGSPTTVQPVVYSTTPEATSEKPAIVNYKESNHNQNLPSVTTINPATTVKSQNPVPTYKDDYKVENEIKKASSPKTYGINLSGGHGHVWNNIDESHFDINKATPSKYVQPELKDKTTTAAANGDKYTLTTTVKPVVYSITSEDTSEKPANVDNKDATPFESAQLKSKDETTPSATDVDKFTLTKIVKPKYHTTPEAKSEEPAIVNYKDATSFESAQLKSKDETTPAATDVDKFTLTKIVKPKYHTSPEAKSEEPAIVNYKESNHNQNLPTATTIKPATAVTSQNPGPTNIKDYKVENELQKYPTPKTYGMNLSGGHGHVWNNIDESHFDINKATPSKSVQPEFEDKTTPAATNSDKIIVTTPVKPLVYTTTPEVTSEKLTIVNYKDAKPSESAQIESKDKTTPAATSNYDLTSTTIVKPIIYTMSPEISSEKPAILPSVTTTNPVTTVKSQKPVSPKAADQTFDNGIMTPSSKTYGMNLSSGHGYVWNNIGGSLEHFDDNRTTPSKLIEPEDKTLPAPTNTGVNFKNSNEFYQESPSVTTVNLATYPYYKTSETLTENATRISYPYRSYNQNIPSVTTPQMLTEKAPTYAKTQKDNEHQNQAPVSKPYLKKSNNSNKDILKRASPRTYGMRLEGDHGYVWNDLTKPGVHYNLDDETNDSNNPTTVNDENSSEVPVTKTPTEDATSANVDPTSKNDNETLPMSTAQPSSESYRLTSTGRNKNKDSSSNNSSELEPEDDLLKYIEKLVKDEVANLLESIKEKNPDKFPVKTEKSNNGNETNNTEPPDTENPTEDLNTSNVSTSTEKVNETTVSVTTERWIEPTSTEAFDKPSTKTPNVNNTTEANDTEKNTTSNKVTPESNEELKKYIEKLVQEEVAKRLENATKTDNTDDKEIKQDDEKPLKENANNTLDNISKNVTNFYGSLIGEGNVTNIFIFYPNDENLEAIVNDAKNIIKPQKNKSNETEADSNKNRPIAVPSTLTTESSTTTNTERPATESTNTPDVTPSSEKDNDTISVTTENSIDSTTLEPKTDSSTDSYETTTKGSPNTTTEANNKKDDETPELKEEIKKYIDKLVKDEVTDQLDKERKNRIEKEKEPEVIPVTTEKSNNNTSDIMSTESPATDKNTEAPDSTNATTTSEINNEKTPITTEKTNNDTTSTESPTSEKHTEAPDSTKSTEQDRETTSESTEKSNNDTYNMMSTKPPTTEEASTQSSEKATTDTPNINSTTEANTKNEDDSPSEPKMPVSAEELKKYVEKLVKDEVAKLLDANKNNGSKNENETDIIPVTTEKANNNSTDTMSTESSATKKNSEAPDSTNATTSSEQDSEITPITTEKTNDTTDTRSTESPVTENNTGAPDSTNATTSNEEDRETNPDPTENSNNDTNDTMSTESPTTEIATQSSEKTTTESSNINSSTEANTKNEDGSPSEPKMPESADELKKYVEKLVKDEVAKLLDAEKNNGSKKENEPDVVSVTTEKSTEENTEAPDSTNATTSSEQDSETTPVTTEKTNNDTTDTTTTESPATKENTEAPDSTNATTSNENGNDTTPMTTEKTNNDTTDTMSTESPVTAENTEAPDSTNATASSEKDTDTTPVTTEGSTESTSEANKEQASTESSNATSTTEANKENDETTSSNMTPKSKEEIKKYVEQLVKEEVAKLTAAGKNDAS